MTHLPILRWQHRLGLRRPVRPTLNDQPKGITMKTTLSILASALFLISAPSFAMSHGGGKMDDKKAEKVDCSKKENKDKKECKAKKEEPKK